MPRGKASACACGPAALELAKQRDDIAIVLVAIPLLAGPGSMAAVMNLVSPAPGPASVASILVAIALTLLVAYAVLRSAGIVQRIVGPPMDWRDGSPPCESASRLRWLRRANGWTLDPPSSARRGNGVATD